MNAITDVRFSLPIYLKKDEIVKAVKESDTVIISAETGSGKSTQVPQFLYEAGYNVIVTEPRKLAAISLCERVHEEMGLAEDSSLVAYTIALESTRTSETKILFCTDGIQLARGIKSYDKTILVIDEVHEWDLNVETLIAWIKQHRLNSGHIKVVLMSATMDVKGLTKYFGDSTKTVEVAGRCYDVEKFENAKESYDRLIVESVTNGKNVLAFRPGKAEIERTIQSLKELLEDIPCVILPLHADLTREAQRKCFKHYDVPKVIVSTNVAQTSITVPDIDVVIDDGKAKVVVVENGVECLKIANISTSDCNQRAGRAGRVKNGEYHLCSYTDISHRDAYSKAEITRLLLDKIVLRLALVGLEADKMEFFHQPDSYRLKEGKELLIKLGALKEDNTVTELGHIISKYPVSTRYAKFMENARVYGSATFNRAIIASAICEVGSLVKSSKEAQGIDYNEFIIAYDDNDLLNEVELYEKIDKGAIDIDANKYINKKSYQRIRDMIQMINQNLSLIDGYEVEDNNEFDEKGFVLSFVSAHFDYVYRRDYYGLTPLFDNGNYEKCVLPKCSTMSRYSSDIVIGIPRRITFKDTIGIERSLIIVSNACGFNTEDLVKLVPKNELSYNISEGDIRYDADLGELLVNAFVVWKGVSLDYTTLSFTDEDEEFATYISKDSYAQKCYELDYAKKSGNPYVDFGTFKLKLRKEFLTGKYICDIEDYELLQLPDDVTEYHTTESIIYFRYHGTFSTNPSVLKKDLIDEDFTWQVNEYVYSIDNSLKHNGNEISKVFPKLGKVQFKDSYGITSRTYYIYLDKAGNRYTVNYCYDEEAAAKRNHDILVESCEAFIEEMQKEESFLSLYKERKLKVNVYSSIVNEFKELSEMAIAEVTFDSYVDTRFMLRDFYNDTIKALSVA